VVTKEHVDAAVELIDRLYSMPTMGYAQRSKGILDDNRKAFRQRDEMRKYMKSRRGLMKFLTSNSSFRRQDLEEVLNVSRESANSIINTLWESRMIRKEGGNVLVEPTLHSVLRGDGR
jgi:hypothetical protein